MSCITIDEPKFAINNEITSIWKAIDYFWKAFPECHENRTLEKLFWKQYLTKFPEQKQDAIMMYDCRRYAIETGLDHSIIFYDMNTQCDDYIDIMNFIKTL